MGKETKVPSWARTPPHGGHMHLRISTDDGVTTRPIDQKAAYVIGRNKKECDIVCEHKSCSRVHACVAHHAEGKVYVVDLGSVHGTIVNGRELSPEGQAQLVKGETKFSLGSCPWTFALESGPAVEQPDHKGEARKHAEGESHREKRTDYQAMSDKPSHRSEDYQSREGRLSRHGEVFGHDDARRNRNKHEGAFRDKLPDRHKQRPDSRERRHSGSRARRREDTDAEDVPKRLRASQFEGMAQDPAAVVRSMAGASLHGGLLTSAEQKKKLLWGKKAEEPAAKDAERVFGANRWDTADFANESDKEKFIKLMGVHKPQGPAPAAQPRSFSPEAEREVLTGEKQAKVLTDVETHFMQGLRRADGRKVGLGL